MNIHKTRHTTANFYYTNATSLQFDKPKFAGQGQNQGQVWWYDLEANQLKEHPCKHEKHVQRR